MITFGHSGLDALATSLQSGRLDGEGCPDQSIGYHGDLAHQMSAEFETQLLLYAFLRRLRPKKVIETGTYVGLTACVLGQALRDNDADGTLFSLDTEDPGRGDGNKGVASHPPPRGHLWSIDVEDCGAQGKITLAELDPWVTLLRGDAKRYDTIEGFPAPPFQFVFIDSDHSTEQALAELHLYYQMLDKGGILAIHDTQCSNGVMEAIRRFPHTPNISITSARGLEIFQK